MIRTGEIERLIAEAKQRKGEQSTEGNSNIVGFVEAVRSTPQFVRAEWACEEARALAIEHQQQQQLKQKQQQEQQNGVASCSSSSAGGGVDFDFHATALPPSVWAPPASGKCPFGTKLEDRAPLN